MDIPVIRNILEANEAGALRLRRLFEERGVFVPNLISAPGAGKTSLLERTLAALAPELRLAVIEGDLQTDNDARRIAAAGAPTVQINTGSGCHLTSAMIEAALARLDAPDLDILFIENVGNMVCPVDFDLGEDGKVALLSVAEGDDKPAKYPQLFQAAQALVVTKIDLLPHVDFDLDRAVRLARGLNAGLAVFPVSCRTGEGLESWHDWLRARAAAKRGRPGPAPR